MEQNTLWSKLYSFRITLLVVILFFIVPTSIFANDINHPTVACTGTVINTFPYNESFETGIGAWTQNTGDDGDWTRDQNGTPSGNTGPIYASDGNFYMYTEASTGGTGSPVGSNANVILTSPCIDLSSQSTAYFSFDYHMFGSAMGSLDVEVSSDGGSTWNALFSIAGQQQGTNINPYRKEILDLTAYAGNTINLRFNATTGTNFRSDLTIDNINITTTPQYCGAMASFNQATIRRVVFNTIDNSTPIEAIGYSDFTSISTDATQGDTHNLSVQINTNGNNLFGVYAWIDWNQDYVFDNSTELYDLGTRTNVTNGTTTNSPLTINIPLTAVVGPTRMRVISRFNGAPLSPCDEDNNFFGEVEDYTINVLSGTPQPEMDITGLSVSIADGDTTPNTADDTDFGTVAVGTNNLNTFTITNSGTAPLNLTGASPYVIITGSTDFVLTAIPNNTIGASNSTTFQITFSPTTVGTHTANISIANDDPNEDPYNFTITGIGSGPEPEVGLSGLGNNILDGDTTPTTVDGTDFGNLLIGSSSFTDFIISNTGTAPLNLTGAAPYVIITGTDAAQFTLTTPPSTPISSSGGTSTFRITYNPTVGGTHQARIVFDNDDGNESPYDFNIIGFASSTLTPEIEITGLDVIIANGDTTPDTTDNTNFGVTDIGTSNVNDFVINNIGTGLLTLTDSSPYITITGVDSGQFSIISIPDNTILAGESTTYQISYTPTTTGVHNARVSVASDDADENPYGYNIQGTAIVNNEPSYTIYYENFDTSDGNWTATNPGGNSVWTHGTNGVEPGTEGDYWYTDNYDNYASNSNTYVTSPVINLIGFDNVQLKLDIRYDTDNDGERDDGMNVEYSNNGGATWQILGAYAATPIKNWYNEDNVDALGAGSDGWAGRNNDGAGGGRSNFVQSIIDLPTTLHNNPLARFRVHFASDGTSTDNGVNIDNVLILGDGIVPLGNPSDGPADIATNLTLWLKTNAGTNGVVDGDAISTWSDQAFDNDSQVANNTAPMYYNNEAENINHNPVLAFDTVNDTQLKGKGGFYTDEYWIVMQSDGTINSSSALEGVVSGRVNTDQFGEDGTGLWINPGSIRFQNFPNLVSHMIGSTPGTAGSNTEPSYGRAYVSNTDNYDNEVIIFNVKYDAANDRSSIFKNGIQIDNHTGTAFNQSTGVAGGELDYGESNNTNYALGVGRITIAGTPYDSHFNGKMTEFISYSAPNSVFDQKRIQSYLAIKNGVTLHSINSTTVTREGDENYIDSDGDIIWNSITHTGYNYDIAGIGRDDDAGLNQKQSTSSNPGAVVTMGLTDVYNTNSENITSNPNTLSEKNFLMWGNDDAPFAADTPITVDMSTGIPGLSTVVDFTAIQRTWKVVERGNVGEVKVRVPEMVLAATLAPPGDYLMFVSDTPSFSPTSEYRVMTLNGANLEASYDFDGVKYLTFGYAPEYYYERSITFDGIQDYLEVGNELDRTGAFTISAWVKRIDRDYSIISKRNAAYTEGYDISLLNNTRLEMSWINGSGTQDIESSTQIPENEWHQFAFTYDGASEAKVYIDGVLDNTETLSPPIATDQSFIIGAADGINAADFFEGTLDEVRVWDIALTEDQVRFIMNQEIEENGDLTVAGRIVPTTISKNEFAATTWSSLAGYFPMNRYTFTNVKDQSSNNLVAAIRNLETVDYQTAPLPYVSQSNGAWTSVATWENGTTQELPGAVSIADNSQTVDWNIVQTGHDVTTNSNNTVLSLEVSSDELSIENQSKMEISHYLKLDGVIDLVDESQLVQTENSDLDPTSVGQLERDQQGTSDTYSYNIWSSPVSTTNATANNQDYTVSNLMLDGSDEDNPINMLFSGGYDGAPGTPVIISAAWLWKFTNDPAGDYSSWQYIGPSGSVSPGEGYTMKGPGTGGILEPQNYTFKGKPNNSTDTEEITHAIDAGNQYLIGNPFPSALDADDFIMDNPHLDGTLHFWQHWGGGTHILAGYQGGYATYTLAGGVPAVSHPSVDPTGSGTITPGRYIPVGQGFFTGATTSGTIVLNNSQRNFVKETSGDSFFFFTGNQVENATASATTSNEYAESLDDSHFDAPDMRQKFRIQFNSAQQFRRELLLTIDEQSTLGYDRMYDGLNSGGPEEDMKWMIDENQAVIQAIKKITSDIELPLLITTATSGVIGINVTDIENEDLNVEIYLKDSLENTYTDLKNDVFNINLDAGEYNGRFYIVFKATEETNDDTSSDDDTSDNDDTSTNDDTSNDDNTSNDDTSNDDTSNNDDTNTGNDTSDDTSTDTTDSDTSSNDDTATDNEAIVAIEEEIQIALSDLDLHYNARSKNIQVTNNQGTLIQEIRLYTVLGQIIKQWTPNSSTQLLELPVNSVSTGAYLVQILTENGASSKKLIIH